MRGRNLEETRGLQKKSPAVAVLAQPSAAAQPNTMLLPPPGGASTREEGLSVMKLLRQGGWACCAAVC